MKKKPLSRNNKPEGNQARHYHKQCFKMTKSCRTKINVNFHVTVFAEGKTSIECLSCHEFQIMSRQMLVTINSEWAKNRTQKSNFLSWHSSIPLEMSRKMKMKIRRRHRRCLLRSIKKLLLQNLLFVNILDTFIYRKSLNRAWKMFMIFSN